MPRVKHLTRGTTIELTAEESHKFIDLINELDNTLFTVYEIQDLYLSDIQKLNDLKLHLIRLFNLDYDRDDRRYIKEKK
tara:strand:+ start:6988 stop:7224 length:237 start_codon:yes stop_codon:yes gene_type:complete